MLSKSLDDLRGWIERCVAFSLHSIVMWNKVPVLPVRNKINLTGGRLSKLLIVFIWHVFTPLVVCLEHECKVLKQISVELYDPVQSYWFKVVCMVTEKKNYHTSYLSKMRIPVSTVSLRIREMSLFPSIRVPFNCYTHKCGVLLRTWLELLWMLKR